MYKRYFFNLNIAWEAIQANRLRSALTALGIIFGVSAVISMLAIGNGAQQEILEQIRLVGLNNIVISTQVKTEENQNSEESQLTTKKGRFSEGLTLSDSKSITKIPTVKFVSPEVIIETTVIKNGLQKKTRLIGVEPAFFNLANFQLDKGDMFNEKNLEYGDQVCIIGRGVESRFFSKENPIGKSIKCGPHWLKIIGVLESQNVSKASMDNLGIRDYDMDIYTPTKTIIIRYRNRSLLTKAAIQKANEEREREQVEGDGKKKKNEESYHQLDRLVVQVKETEYLSKTAEIVGRMLKRRHFDEVDYDITIPEQLLKQQQKTKAIFNIVLGVIAGISLLVGGIGIMNIMLASVLERIKEIGLRLSIGAKKSDIVQQFMFEAILISVSGGFIGVILGITMSYFISYFANIPTIVSFGSIVLSFVVSATVGLIFGIAPARRAAQQDPISSLRYE